MDLINRLRTYPQRAVLDPPDVKNFLYANVDKFMMSDGLTTGIYGNDRKVPIFLS